MVASAEPYYRKGFASPHEPCCHTVCHTFYVCHTRFNAIGVSFLIPHVLRSPIGGGRGTPSRPAVASPVIGPPSPRGNRMEPDTRNEWNTGERHAMGFGRGETCA